MVDIVQFQEERLALNELVMANANRDIKRFLNLDTQTYTDGALPKKTKELLGLVASMVLRCDDCIKYHLIECHKAGFTTEEITEAFSVALIVGGSIVIPHLRRAYRSWEELLDQPSDSRLLTPES
ncbi:MAG: carboxymuconolactone decarboxylase family protein [Anaerolineae bacterium]|nr:carboxymuconolactone decarboxylase family protein [Anaerolineae bacterium]